MGTLVTILVWTFCLCSLIEANCVINPNATDIEKQENLLQKLAPLMGKSSKTKTLNGYEYDFTLCENADPNYPGASIIQTLPGGSQKIVLGYNNQTLVSSKGSWLMLTLEGGDKYKDVCNETKRQVHILFVCDPYQKEIVQIETLDELTNDSCYLQFAISHSIVCPKAPVEGLSGGAIFFILVLVTFGAYFVFGFCYLRLVKGAKGIEQIPNLDFWFKIGNMFADGCGAICRCDQYCGSGTGARPGSGAMSTSTTYNGYSPIEERMARDLQDTDRDSALLSP